MKESKIILQNLLFPKIDICTQNELYFRLKNNAYFSYSEQKLILNNLAKCSFNTYFNAYSMEKRKRINTCQKIYFSLKFQGEIELNFVNSYLSTDGAIIREIKGSWVIKSASISTQIVELPNVERGILYPEIVGLNRTNYIYGGCYFCKDEPTNYPKIAVVICTYKREKFLLNNIAKLQELLDDNKTFVNNNLVEVFVVDNGNTLKRYGKKGINIISQKNFGGAGGFARGMIEASKKNFTNVLLMDDDVIFEPDIFIRLYGLLSYIKDKETFIGGSMFRLDRKNIQNELADRWDYQKRKVNPIGHLLDLNEEKNVLLNEETKSINYLSWWFCCIPMSIVKENLPLPLFIKRDDIEYGLRCGKKFATLNGINVWHEPFETKRTPILEYYYLRNRLIMDSVLNKEKSLISLKKEIFIESAKNIKSNNFDKAYFRLLGAFHFTKSAEFLTSIDPNVLHKVISQKVPAHPPHLIKNIIKIIPLILKTFFHLDRSYYKAVNSYKDNYNHLTSYDFWTSYLFSDNLSKNVPTLESKMSLKKILTLLSYYLSRFILKLLPIRIDKYRITFYVRGRKAFCDNPKYLMNKLISTYKDKYDIYWITDDILSCQELTNNEVKIIKNRTYEHLKVQLSSKFVIYNDYLPAYIPKKKNQIYINLWHGGINYKNIGFDYLQDKSHFNRIRFRLRNPEPNYMVSGSEFFTSNTARAFNYKESVFLPCGLPRNDIFFDKSLVAKISKEVKDYYGVSNKKIALYAPTFRIGFSATIHGLKVDEVLSALSKKFGGEWVLFYRAHGFVKSMLDIKNENIIDVSSYPDVQELLTASLAIITDYSSISWDASFLDLPIFLYTPDIDDYREFERNFAYPIEDLPYPLAKSNEELIANINSFDYGKYKNKLKAHHDKAGSYENASSSIFLSSLIDSLTEK